MAPWRYASLLDACRELAANGAPDEEILGNARSEGASLLESIRLYREVRDVPLDVAKEKVHLSKTWADQRKAYDRFHDVVERVAREVESRDTKE
jgi:CRISPR/Cas system type I-B associated protein Csh2 (Cas7 group RAMP superfamily)